MRSFTLLRHFLDGLARKRCWTYVLSWRCSFGTSILIFLLIVCHRWIFECFTASRESRGQEVCCYGLDNYYDGWPHCKRHGIQIWTWVIFFCFLTWGSLTYYFLRRLESSDQGGRFTQRREDRYLCSFEEICRTSRVGVGGSSSTCWCHHKWVINYIVLLHLTCLTNVVEQSFHLIYTVHSQTSFFLFRSLNMTSFPVISWYTIYFSLPAFIFLVLVMSTSAMLLGPMSEL